MRLSGFRFMASILAVLLLRAMTIPQAGCQTAVVAGDSGVTDRVVHDLCDERVALLGESPVHGFGKTLEFKAQLVRRLVDECHYDALFVESGAYDYIDIQRRLNSGQDVTDSMISAAIGGLWADKEVQTLVPFLRDRVKSGRLTLGGLDDQLGAGTYASHRMPADLAQYLQGDERARCLAVLERHMQWQYTDDAPYGPADKSRILSCLDEIEARIPATAPGAARFPDGDRVMVANLRRNLARNFTEDDFTKKDQELKWRGDREQSMYLNFQWLLSRLPSQGKVIVWAATVHTAKELHSVGDWDGSVPLGSSIRKEFGDRAFSLGFSAYSGSYVASRPPVRQLSVAPVTSLEGQAFAHAESGEVYFPRQQLQELGAIPGRPLGTSFKTAKWDEVLDGLVVFREERPPELLPIPHSAP